MMIKEELMKTLKAWTAIRAVVKKQLAGGNSLTVFGGAFALVLLMVVTSVTAEIVAPFALLFAAPRLILWALDKYGK